ncbi:MAG: DUF1735 domain-containing protein [Chitinophagaceae bacterium]
MNTRKILFVALAFTVAAVGCKRKDAPTPSDVKYSGAPMVNFNNYGGYEKVGVELADKWIPFDYEVKLSNTTQPAANDISVTLQKDDNPLGEFNTANGASLVTVPINAFKVENWVVTIKKGARKANFHFEINPAKLNLANSYGFGFSILSVSGGGATVNVTDEETRMLVELGTLNDYDGIYNKTSFFSHPTSLTLGGIYGVAAPLEVEMITSGATSVDSYVTAFYQYPTEVVVNWATPAYTYFTGVNPRFTINPTTNAVTISESPNSADVSAQAVFAQNAADVAASKFYPTGIPGISTTKTIVGHFRWSVPNDRIARDTFVFVRKR